VPTIGADAIGVRLLREGSCIGVMAICRRTP
jgi:hypothetical protein